MSKERLTILGKIEKIGFTFFLFEFGLIFLSGSLLFGSEEKPFAVLMVLLVLIIIFLQIHVIDIFDKLSFTYLRVILVEILVISSALALFGIIYVSVENLEEIMQMKIIFGLLFIYSQYCIYRFSMGIYHLGG